MTLRAASCLPFALPQKPWPVLDLLTFVVFAVSLEAPISTKLFLKPFYLPELPR